MKRLNTAPRPDWERIVESQGLIFHSASGPYWTERACYSFTPAEIETIENSTRELHGLCLQAVEHVIRLRRYRELAIPERAIPAIEASWEADMPSIYGRFDLAWTGEGPPKMLEYNADTPTSLLEAAVIQWFWKEDLFPDHDQFNSIHERLIAKWRELGPYLSSKYLHFAGMDDHEDIMTVTYLRDTAQQAGYVTAHLDMEQIGWNEAAKQFRDLAEMPIKTIFKLYPWEWMINEPFGAQALASVPATQWIEPPWKMILSNKGILKILWRLFEGHPNLLQCHDTPDLLRDPRAYVRKPLLSREGANVSIVLRSGAIETGGDYGEEGHVYQEIAPLPCFDGNYPVLGTWVIDGEPAGMGIRESMRPITDNTSQFIPHIIK